LGNFAVKISQLSGCSRKRILRRFSATVVQRQKNYNYCTTQAQLPYKSSHQLFTSALVLDKDFQFTLTTVFHNSLTSIQIWVPYVYEDNLCGLVVRVPGHRSGGPSSIPGATRFSEKWVWNGVHSASRV
jgi:hypothetical protein